MSDVYDLFAIKPTSIWLQGLSTNPSEVIASLSKAAICFITTEGKDSVEHIVDVFKNINISDNPASSAWLLIFRSLQKALVALLEEYANGDFFESRPPEADLHSINIAFENALNELEIGLNVEFFKKPDQLPLLDTIQCMLVQWLTGLGMREADALAFHQRLKSKFVVSLHQEWGANSSEYECIKNVIDTPLVQAVMKQREWMQYRAWLQEKSDERMFAEAFSLAQVYVPLRAFYEEKTRVSDLNESDLEERYKVITKRQIVVDLHEEIESWAINFNQDDSVRIISGGPGSGKSTFAKIFAARFTKSHPNIPTIFIPLHHFDLNDDLTSSVEGFIKDERFLSENPLNPSNGENRLLIIFDGLDELSMQGKAAAETAQHFVLEVTRKIDKFNGQKLRRQVLITGRNLAIQSASSYLRTPKQILHILPYYIPEEDRKDFHDTSNLLAVDQRDTWWMNYSRVKGLNLNNMPSSLQLERLEPITKEPLLNYLIALSYQRKKINLTEKTTLNSIYEDLLHAVYERQWDNSRIHYGAKPLTIDQFIRTLEEIALAVWHGDGRTATVNQIYHRCQNNNLERYLDAFQEGAKKGVSRLLTAFYFRQSVQCNSGEETFEFTHKSFGEYLTARRIVRSIKQIHNGIVRHLDDPDEGFGENEALMRWINVCGPTPMDEYIFQFFHDEITTYQKQLYKVAKDISIIN